MNSKRLLALIIGAAGLASAHLDPVSTPTAGQTFAPGATVNLKWGIGSAHDGQDIAFSTDGSTWTTVATNINRSLTTFNWTVPDGLNSSTVRLRVCQRDGDGVQGCTNAHNANALNSGISVTGGKVYVTISPVFSVSGASNILSPAVEPKGARLRFDASVRSLEATFPMERAGKVTLQAFDTQGKLLSTLLDEHRAQGEHHVSLFSSTLDATKTTVFRLQAGDKVFQHAAHAGR